MTEPPELAPKWSQTLTGTPSYGYQRIAGRDIPIVSRWEGNIPTNGPALMILQGLPGSGKTTFTEALLYQRPDTTRRVSRDHLRRMLFDAPFIPGHPDDREAPVTTIQLAAIRTLLGWGFVVIMDDTNLHRPHLDAMVKAVDPVYQADIKIVDFTGVPITECIDRDRRRPEHLQVGAHAITSMWARWQDPTT